MLCGVFLVCFGFFLFVSLFFVCLCAFFVVFSVCFFFLQIVSPLQVFEWCLYNKPLTPFTLSEPSAPLTTPLVQTHLF